MVHEVALEYVGGIPVELNDNARRLANAELYVGYRQIIPEKQP